MRHILPAYACRPDHLEVLESSGVVRELFWNSPRTQRARLIFPSRLVLCYLVFRPVVVLIGRTTVRISDPRVYV
jgi:hypothetical protein